MAAINGLSTFASDHPAIAIGLAWKIRLLVISAMATAARMAGHRVLRVISSTPNQAPVAGQKVGDEY